MSVFRATLNVSVANAQQAICGCQLTKSSALSTKQQNTIILGYLFFLKEHFGIREVSFKFAFAA